MLCKVLGSDDGMIGAGRRGCTAFLQSHQRDTGVDEHCITRPGLDEGDLDGVPRSVVVLSLIQEVDRDEPFSATETRLRARLTELVGSGAPVLVCTVFRQVAERRTPEGSGRLERIRRLNRLTAELSHDLGVTVVDIDRAFAHIGGRVLASDYRLGGRLAAEVAGHTLVWSLLSLGLDEVISPEVQERAMAFHGGLREINRLVSRRLAAG